MQTDVILWRSQLQCRSSCIWCCVTVCLVVVGLILTVWTCKNSFVSQEKIKSQHMKVVLLCPTSIYEIEGSTVSLLVQSKYCEWRKRAGLELEEGFWCLPWVTNHSLCGSMKVWPPFWSSYQYNFAGEWWASLSSHPLGLVYPSLATTCLLVGAHC
jgi:hypothetical protein